MAKSVALSTIRTKARQLADLVNSQRVTDAELTNYVNRAYGELYDLLVGAYGEEYFLSSADTATVANQNDYALPATFYQLRAVDLIDSASIPHAIKRFTMAERNTRRNAQSNIDTTLYQVRGANLRLIPAPPAGYTLRIWYVPAFTNLSADADTMDSVNGWDEFVATRAAEMCLLKLKRDASALTMEAQQQKERITAMAPARDSNEPMRVTDVERIWDVEDLLDRGSY